MLVAFYMGKKKRCFNNCKGGLCYSWWNYCRRYFCKHCGLVIETGEEAVRLILPRTEHDRARAFTFHRRCYVEQFQQWLDYQYRTHPLKIKVKQPKPETPKGRAGRPMSSANPELMNILRTKQSYHRRMGHLEKVSELQIQIDGLVLKVVSPTSPSGEFLG